MVNKFIKFNAVLNHKWFPLIWLNGQKINNRKCFEKNI